MTPPPPPAPAWSWKPGDACVHVVDLALTRCAVRDRSEPRGLGAAAFSSSHHRKAAQVFRPDLLLLSREARNADGYTTSLNL